MTYAIRLRPAARRQFRTLTPEVQRRLLPRIDALAESPRPPGAESLSGLPGLYRIRVGDYRIVYQVLDEELIVLIVSIGHRREVYRRLDR